MTNIAWFLFGFGVGGLVFGLVTYFSLNRILEITNSTNAFVVNYANTTDKQYSSLEKYVERRADLFSDFCNGLTDIVQKYIHDSTELSRKLAEFVKAGHDHTISQNAAMVKRVEEVIDVNRDLVDLAKVNDERWNLIHDYICNYDERR